MQLIRPTFALVTVPDPRGETRTEFGDITMFDVTVLALARSEENRTPDQCWTNLCISERKAPRAPVSVHGRLARRWEGFTPGFPDCWPGSSPRTRSPSPIHRPATRRKTPFSYNLFLRFTCGTNGTCVRQRPTGQLVGITTIHHVEITRAG